MDSADNTIQAGAAAWQRIRDHGRKNFDDWIRVAEALAIGRSVALKAAGTNRPVGARYTRAITSWLRQHDLDGISTQERYRALLILGNLAAITTWRDALDDAQRRRLNHPGAIWARWQKSVTEQAMPRLQRAVRSDKPRCSGKYTRPVHLPSDMLRRAANAIREARSNDCIVLAKASLQAAIRDERDLLELLPAYVPPRPLRNSTAAR